MPTYNTRIQLKYDTEENWLLVEETFKPLSGEMIIYSPDSNHGYCRVKIGDGKTFLKNLNFVDSGTVNGEEVEVVKCNNFQSFPSPGSSDKLYLDLAENRIYHYEPTSGYKQLSNFEYKITKSSVGSVGDWKPGVLTTASIEDNTFKVSNGTLPQLVWGKMLMVQDVQKVVKEATT